MGTTQLPIFDLSVFIINTPLSLTNPNLSRQSSVYELTTICEDVGCFQSESYLVEICLGDTIQVFAGNGSNYFWIPDYNISNDTIRNPFIFPLVDTFYVVSYISDSNCISFDTFQVTVNGLPEISILPNDTTICVADTIALIASGATSYLWSPEEFLSNINSPSPLAFPEVSTLFTVIGVDGNGCESADSVYIDIVVCCGSEASFIPSDTFLCVGDLVTFQNTSVSTGIAVFSWDFGNSAIPSQFEGITPPAVIFPESGVHEIELILTDDCGSDSSTIDLFVENLPEFDIIDDTVLCSDEANLTIQLGDDPIDGFEYNWTPVLNLNDPFISNPIASVDQAITYTVVVSDLFTGCSNADSVEISLQVCDTVVETGVLVLCPKRFFSQFGWRKTTILW